MDKRKLLIFLRNLTLSLSILCLFILSFFVLRFIRTGIDNKKTIQSPVEVYHRVLFISSFNPIYYTYEAQKSGLEKALYSHGI